LGHLVCHVARGAINSPAQAFPTPALREEHEGLGTRRIADTSEIKSGPPASVRNLLFAADEP
jgi:hypothetical protein